MPSNLRSLDNSLWLLARPQQRLLIVVWQLNQRIEPTLDPDPELPLNEPMIAALYFHCHG